jgi:hypothetical protein
VADAGELLPLAVGVEEVGAPAVGDISGASEKVEVVHALPYSVLEAEMPERSEMIAAWQ